MTEIEKIRYAKSFIDKLANGINPIDDSAASEKDIVNNIRISRCLFYVSDILRQVIDNDGITAVNKGKKLPFTLSPEVLYSEIVVPSAVASKSMVFDKFAEFVEEAYEDIISFAIAVPPAYSCTERLPSVVLSPVTP